MYCGYCYREADYEELFQSDELGDSFHTECIFKMIEDDPDDLDVRVLYFEWLQTM